MTVDEFRAWLDGYVEGAPEPDVARIVEKAREIAVTVEVQVPSVDPWVSPVGPTIIGVNC